MNVGDIKQYLEQRPPARVEGEGLRPAAVLVPLIVPEGGGIDLLLTRRTQTTSKHAGEIGFPGGVIDPTDRDAAAAALRETEEELGISPHLVEVLGELDGVVTITQFAITPIVGRLAERPVIRRNVAEVEEALVIPLDFFESERAMELIDIGDHKGVIVYQYGDVRVWGATARIIKRLVDGVRSVQGGVIR